MKEEEVKIRRLMQKCEDWLSDKIHDGTGNDKWWRLDQVLKAINLVFGFACQVVHNTSLIIMQNLFHYLLQYITTLDSRIRQLETPNR